MCAFDDTYALTQVHSRGRTARERIQDFLPRYFGFTVVGAKPISFDDGEVSYLSSHPKVIFLFLKLLRERYGMSSDFILKTEYEEIPSERIPIYYIELIHKKALKDLYRHQLNEHKFALNV